MNYNKHNTWLWLGLISLTVSLGQLQKLQLDNQIAVYVHELLMSGWLLLTFIRQPGQAKQLLTDWRTHLTTFRLPLILSVWIVIGWRLAAVAGSLPATTFLYASRLLFYLVFWLTVSRQLELKRLSRSALHLVLLVSGSLVMWFGLLQYVVVPDIRSLAILGWDDHYYRLVSTFFDPAFTGMALVLIFNLGLRWPTHPYLRLAWLWLAVAAIALTYSRASYLSLAVFISLLITLPGQQLNRSTKHSVLFALTAFIILLALPARGGEGVKLSRTSTIQARAVSLTQGLSQLQGYKWLTGAGLFNSLSPKPSEGRIVYHAVLPDNIILLVLGGTGLVGAGLTLIFLIQLFKVSWDQQPQLLPILSAVLIHSLFSATLTYPLVLFYLGGTWLVNTKSKSGSGQ